MCAASSLNQAFKEIAQHCQALHPNARVLLNFGAFGALLQQISKGTPIDVFALADQDTMSLAKQQGLVAASEQVDSVCNRLVLIVSADSKLSITGLPDL